MAERRIRAATAVVAVQVWIFCLALAVVQAPAASNETPMSFAAARVDPYKAFKFRVKIEGRAVAGFAKIAGLPQSSRAGSPPGTITLQQGATHDTVFETWAGAALNRPASVRRKRDKKDIVIEVLSETGSVARAYFVSQTWVSSYQAVPDLDANANAVAIEFMKL